MRIRRKPWTSKLIKEQTGKLLISKLDFLSKPIKETFNNDNKLVLEIGSGKGDFICNLAKLNPDTNFIGVEQDDTVVGIALRKIINEDLKNVRLIHMNAEEMLNVFMEKEVDIIRLNFSDPWPKKKHAERRLTSKKFLDLYKKILKDEGRIIFKTDNVDLFDFSLASFKENDWDINEVNRNYPLTENKDDVPTEYEKKFRKEGKPIYYLEAIKLTK